MSQNNNPIINELRKQVDDLTQERDQYRRLYEAEVVENEQLSTIRKNLRTNYQLALNQINRLKLRIQDLKEVLAKHNPKIFRKRWDEVSAQTKRKRKNDYREVIDNALETIPECKKAKLEIYLGHDKVKFTWSEEDMAKCRNSARQKGFGIIDPAALSSDDENDIDEESKKIVTSRLKEEVIHVMDRYRISQDAYHEMQQTLKTIPMPPIHHIKKQKRLMSVEIPYIKEPDVSYV